MIEISRDEVKVIREQVPSATIRSTGKKRKSRRKYWCEANENVLKIISMLRDECVSR